MLRPLLLSFAILVFAAVSGCAGDSQPVDEADGSTDGEDTVAPPDSDTVGAEEGDELTASAGATIEPLGGSGVYGPVTFARTVEGVRLTYNIEGLEPGRYGFHVHEYGSCADGDDGTPGSAAGGHFNPAGTPHGAPDVVGMARHVGDLGNLYVLSDSSAVGTFSDPLIELDGENSIVGKALMIHAEEDDFSTQPTGAAGARIGCGVIAGIEA